MTNKEIIKAMEDLLSIGHRISGCSDVHCLVCDENRRIKSCAQLALEALKENYPRFAPNQKFTMTTWAHRGYCDSLDHNDNDGCSNPKCSKYYGRKP